MAELAHLRAKLGLRKDGNADHPDFNKLKIVKDSGMDWAYYIDAHGLGWCYSLCGHKEEEPDSPRGMQWACLCISQKFVDQACKKFPAICSEIIEEEFEEFHDVKAHGDQDDELLDKEVLEGIYMKQKLGKALNQQQLDALDPEKSTKGICRNKKKYWVDVKASKGVTCASKERVNGKIRLKAERV